MAVKKNLYASVDIEKLEKEISSHIEYLENLDVFNIADDINFNAIPRPQVISTIEKKISTALRVIQSSANIALALYDKHGMTPFIEHLIFTTTGCLKEVQDYYEGFPISKIQHRYAEGITYDRKGNPRTAKVMANSKEDQIASRVMITEKILVILPLIEKLEEVKAAVALKGDKELPESMMY